MSDEIVAFIKAQLDLDEQLARDAGATRSGKIASWWVDCGCPGKLADEHADACWDRRVEGDNIVIYDEGVHDEDQAQHIARHDPERVLADVEMKRQLLAVVAEMRAQDGWGFHAFASQIEQALAAPFVVGRVEVTDGDD